MTNLVSVIDSIMVGRFVGTEALAAVGSTTSLINTIIGLFLGCSVGASIVASQYYGAQDTYSLKSTISTTLLGSIFFSFVFTVLSIFLTPALLRLMSTPDDVFPQAELYLKIYFSGLPALILYNMSSGLLRAIGDSRAPTISLLISSVCNIVLDYVLIVFFDLGIAGAALATVASEIFSAVYLIIKICTLPAAYRFSARQIKMDSKIGIRILSLGLPYGIQRTINGFSNTIVQSYINAFGSSCMAGYSIYNKIHQFALVPMDSIGTATATFVGQNYGAKNWDRIRASSKYALLLNFGVTLFISLIIIVLASPLAKIFSEEGSSISYAVFFISIIMPFMAVPSFNRSFSGAVRGLGDSMSPMIYALLGFVVVRQLYLIIGTRLSSSITIVALSYPVGWIAASVFTGILFSRKIKRIPKGDTAQQVIH